MVHLAKPERRSKPDHRGWSRIFLGLSDNGLFKVLNADSVRVHMFRNVRFDERKFPAKKATPDYAMAKTAVLKCFTVMMKVEARVSLMATRQSRTLMELCLKMMKRSLKVKIRDTLVCMRSPDLQEKNQVVIPISNRYRTPKFAPMSPRDPADVFGKLRRGTAPVLSSA